MSSNVKNSILIGRLPLIFGCCLVLGQWAFAGKGNVPLELKNYPRELVYSRHDVRKPGTHDQTTVQQSFSDTGKGFSAANNFLKYRTTMNNSEYCQSLLDKQQAYAIDKMSTTDYLDSAEAAFYKKLGGSIKPDQVSFLEMLRLVPHNDPIVSQIAQRNFIEDYTYDHDRPYRTASLWSVAGQRLDPETYELEITDLPWQLEQEWAEESKNLDRNKYKYVWEWGRAAQDLSGDIEPLYQANALANLREFVAYGGAFHDKMDLAYVMFHSLSKVNTRLYERAFPGTRFASKSDDNVLFLVPLADVLKRYPPSEISSVVNGIKELAPSLSDVQILHLIELVRSSSWEELDLKNTENRIARYPIIVREWSDRIRHYMMINTMLEMGLSRQQVTDVGNYLMRNLKITTESAQLGQYIDVADRQLSMNLFHTDSMQISNVPKELAQEDGGLIYLLLTAYDYRMRTLLMFDKQIGLAEQRQALRLLLDINYKFIVTTGDRELAQKLVALGGVISEDKFEEYPEDIPMNQYLEDMGVFVRPRTNYFIRFTIGDLAKLANERPDISDSSQQKLVPGSHRLFYKLRAMELL